MTAQPENKLAPIQWECSICVGELGMPGILPMASTSCGDIGHMLCCACLMKIKEKSDTDGVKTRHCPECRAVATNYVALVALIDLNADRQSAALLARWRATRDEKPPTGAKRRKRAVPRATRPAEPQASPVPPVIATPQATPVLPAIAIPARQVQLSLPCACALCIDYETLSAPLLEELRDCFVIDGYAFFDLNFTSFSPASGAVTVTNYHRFLTPMTKIFVTNALTETMNIPELRDRFAQLFVLPTEPSRVFTRVVISPHFVFDWHWSVKVVASELTAAVEMALQNWRGRPCHAATNNNR